MEVPAILPELAPAPICIIDTTPNITPEETDFALMPVAAAEYENADVVYSALSLSELPATSPPPAPPKATSIPSRHSAAEYTPPQYAATPQPNYPAHLRQRRISGDVRVRIHINAQGKATKVEILSSPHPDLSRVTREKILTAWLFRAAKQGGKAVASVVTTTVCFES